MDAFMLTDRHFGELQPEVELADVADCLPPGWDVERESFPSVFEAYRGGGGLFGIPLAFPPVVLAYNRDLFDAAAVPYPDATWTWQRLVEAAKRLTRDLDGDGDPVQYGFCFSSALNRWLVWLVQNGADLRASGRRRCRFDDPLAHEAVQFAVDLMYRHRVSPVFGHASDYAAERLFPC
ncbi:MAG: extracellular solute-binding protein [Chloroflexi bacterium]|nr:extracellular solute-binding protein [Chloroflexota bacterium]